MNRVLLLTSFCTFFLVPIHAMDWREIERRAKETEHRFDKLKPILNEVATLQNEWNTLSKILVKDKTAPEAHEPLRRLPELKKEMTSLSKELSELLKEQYLPVLEQNKQFLDETILKIKQFERSGKFQDIVAPKSPFSFF